MRRIMAALVTAGCIAGAALAQEAPLVFRPTWEAEPQQADYVSLYPREALAQNISGIAVLCCWARLDRSLNCQVNSEWPSGRGFGAASVRASERYRLTQASYNDLHARADTPVRISMMWAGPVLTDDIRMRLATIDHETAYACTPPTN